MFSARCPSVCTRLLLRTTQVIQADLSTNQELVAASVAIYMFMAGLGALVWVSDATPLATRSSKFYDEGAHPRLDYAAGQLFTVNTKSCDTCQGYQPPRRQ